MVFDAAQNTVAIADMVKTLVGPRIELDSQHLDAACWVDADHLR